MKIYDAFLFFNELDLLEIRLNLLNDYVDFFIISESDVTFSGKSKPLYYQDNKERFKAFEHKIIHQVIKDTPTNFVSLPYINQPKNKDEACVNMIYSFIDKAVNFPKEELHWGRDFFQRECLQRSFVNCADDDIIMFSDIDEIPNPETFKKVINFFPSKDIYTLRQKEYNYYLNLFKQDGWMGPRVANYSTLKKLSLNEIRAIIPGDRTMVDTQDVPNGGWHFTSLGGTEKIIQKIESWGHQEFNTSKVKDNVRKQVESGKDIFHRRGSNKLKKIEVDEKNFPKWLVDNREKYDHLINHTYVNESFSGVKDLFRKIFRL